METITRLKMNNKEQTEIILENFSKMLFRRKLIKNYKNTLENIKNIESKGVFSWKENDYDFVVMIIFNKINGVKKGSDLEELLIKSKNKKTFIIAQEVSNKTYLQVKDFDGELFTTFEFLSDIPSNPLIPEHIILNDSQKEELLKIYKEKNLAKILLNDMMVRYIGANRGDIIKIIRPTYNTGSSVYYRKVV